MRIAHRTDIVIIIVTRLPGNVVNAAALIGHGYGGGPISIVAVAVVAAEPVRADPNKSFREILIIA